MGAVKYISGFSGIQHAKQNLRRSSHVGSDLTSGNTVLNPSETFDAQACFVYLNGVLLKEGSSEDYTLSGNNTITFTTAVDATDIVEVISYNFTNPTLPETMVETDHTITSGESNLHSTAVTGASYTASTDTLTKTGGFTNNSAGDVISVTASPTSGSLAVGRYRILTKTDNNNVVLVTVNDEPLTYSTDSASANIDFTNLFSKRANNLTLQSKALVFLNGMLLVENTDFFRDTQAITIDSTVNLQQNHVVAIRHFGSFVFPNSSEASHTGIEILDDAESTLLTSADVGTSNTTSVFKIEVSARHATATNTTYRLAQFVVRAEKNSASDCTMTRLTDTGDIGADFEVIHEGGYSSYSSATDGKIALAVHADANYWYVYLINRSGHTIVSGFKASAISS